MRSTAEQDTGEVASDTQNAEPIKSPGRPRKGKDRLTVQLGARISTQTAGWLDRISEFEGCRPPDLIREMLLQLIRRYRRDPFFQTWMQDREEKAAKQHAGAERPT